MSAIYHFSAQIISRADGRSSVAAAAYRSAEKMIDERTGTAHDFTKKRGVFHSEIMLPADAPADFSDRPTLWNAVEKAEKRKNSQLAREIDIALPRCLTHDQKIALAKDYVQKTFVNAGMIADVCFHDLDSDNPHLHVMLTTREVSASGFGNKNRDWNDRELLKEWRKDWASYANRAMENAGHSHRIDHRTLEAQGIDREPQVHLGAARSAMLKKGKRVDSIEPQLERQRLKRAAQQAANDKIKDAQLYAQSESIQNELEQLEQQLHAERERAHEQQHLEARISAARVAIAAENAEQQRLTESITRAQSEHQQLAATERDIIDVTAQINERTAAAEQRITAEIERITNAITAVNADTERGKEAVRQQRQKIEEAEQEQRRITDAIERARAIAAAVGRTVSRAVGAATGSISKWLERRAEQRRTAAEIEQITAEIEQITAATAAAERQHGETKNRCRRNREFVATTNERIAAVRDRISRAAPLAVPTEQRPAIEALAKELRTSRLRAGTGGVLSTQDALRAAIDRYAKQQRTESERRADAFLDVAERIIDNDKATDMPTDHNTHNTPKM